MLTDQWGLHTPQALKGVEMALLDMEAVLVFWWTEHETSTACEGFPSNQSTGPIRFYVTNFPIRFYVPVAEILERPSISCPFQHKVHEFYMSLLSVFDIENGLVGLIGCTVYHQRQSFLLTSTWDVTDPLEAIQVVQLMNYPKIPEGHILM